MGWQLDLKLEPTDAEVCLMCHLSSGCKGCCKTCKSKCNAGQLCQIGIDNQADRLESWLWICSDVPFYKDKLRGG
jgi:hypothetical protein